MTTVLWYSDGNHNFTASNAWNQAADGSGTAGNPDTDDRVIIQSGDTVTLDNNVTIGSCGISGTLTGNTSYSLTLAGSSEDFNYSNSGTVTNLNIIMTGLRASGDRSMIDIGSGIRDLTLNDATNSGNNVHHIASNLSISGDLTITEGTLNTGHGGTDRALTVAGTTQVAGTLTCGSSAVSLGSGKTDGYGLNVASGGTFTGGTGTHTWGSANLQASTTLTSGTTTIDSAFGTTGFWADTNFTHNSGTVAFTRNGDQKFGESGTDTPTRTFNHLIVNKAGGELTWVDDHPFACVVAGNLTITAGELDTGPDNVALTVTGTTTLTGTLNLNGSTASFNSGATAGGVILGTAGYINGDADSTVTMGSISATDTGNRGVSLAGTNTINKYKASDDKIINLLDGTVDGTTLFTVTTTDAKGFALQDYTASLTLNPGSSTVYKLEDTMNVNHLTINSNASLTTLDGSSSRNITATGDCIVDGTLTGNASTITLGSLTVGGTYSATSGTTTITSERSNGRAIDIVGTYTHNSGTLKIQTAADTDLRYPSSNPLNNLIIDHASCIARPTGDNKPVIGGDLTINQGKYSLLDSDGSATHQSTVTGDVIIGDGSGSANTAIFEGRDDSVTFGSLTIDSDGKYDATSGTTTITSEDNATGYAWYNVSGTFTHNSGTVNFTSTADTHLRDDTFYNLTITGGASSSDFYYRPKDGGTGAVTIAHDLTIVEGLFRPAGAAGALTVTGDVSIESGGVLGQDDSSGAMTFGSLTIASGGTYIATSGTTTLATADTQRAGYGGQPSALEVISGGTFTHNNGTIKLTSIYDQDIEMDGTGTLYNLTFNKSDNDVIHTSSLVIENNLDVTLAAGHSLRPSSGSNTVTVRGNTYLTTGNIGDTTQYTGTNNWGLVTINSGEFILSTGTNNVSGIRNVGGTVSQS